MLTVEEFLYRVNPETELQALPLENPTRVLIFLRTEAVDTEMLKQICMTFGYLNVYFKS